MSPCPTSRPSPQADGTRPLFITDLGASAGYFVWGMRACIRGQASDSIVEKAFSEVFGHDAASILADIHALAALVGKSARNRPTIGAPGCACLTPHEISMVRILASAQAGEGAAVEAHLVWMVTPQDRAVLKVLIHYLADRFTCHGLVINPPPAPAPPQRATPRCLANKRSVATAATTNRGRG